MLEAEKLYCQDFPAVIILKRLDLKGKQSGADKPAVVPPCSRVCSPGRCLLAEVPVPLLERVCSIRRVMSL